MDPKLLFLTRARKFSGKSGDNWDTWISHFEAQTITFDDAGRLQCLLSLLDDDALDAFIAMPAKVKVKYDTAKKSLDARFGRTIDRLQALAELNKSTQATGESVEKFGERLRKLGKLAYPEAIEGDKTAESSLTCRFICGLRDEWIQSKICGRNPGTLDEAVQMVQTLRGRQEALQAVRSTALPAVFETLEPSRGAVVEDVGSADRVYALEQRVDDMGRALQALAVSGGRGERRTPGVEQRRCYNCGEEGHFRRQCPAARQRPTGNKDERQRGQETPQSGARAADPAVPAFCWCCGRRGHWMAECRFLPGSVGVSQPVNNTQNGPRVTQAEN